MYQTKIIKKIDNEFITQWKELWDNSANPNIYNSYEWFLTSQEVHGIEEYEIFCLFKNEKLVAILPTQTYKCFGVTVKGSINKDHLIDTPFLLETFNKDLFKQFFSFVLTQNVFLQKIDEEAAKVLRSVFPTLFFSLISTNPILKLSGNPEESMSPSTVSQIKKILRKNPELRFEVHNTNLLHHMKTMFKIQNISSKKARAMDVFENKEVKKYYLTMTKNFEKAIRLCFLYYGDTPIAYQYGFFSNNSFIGDQISFHRDYSKLRPGKTIVYLLIEYLKNTNAKLLDQGGGISAYKQEFTKEYRVLYNLYYSPNMFIMWWWKSINKVRRMKQVLFPKKNTRDHEFLFKTF